MCKPIMSLLLIMAAVAVLAGRARADPFSVINSSSTESNGVFTGSIDYSFASATSATFRVTLSNDNASGAGGSIVAFAFNNPGNLISAVNLVSTLSSFSTLMGGAVFQNGVSANPFGTFDIGASAGGDWLSGGKVKDGIARGNTATFTFTLTGKKLNTLTTQSFVNELSKGGSDFFAVRFKGFDNGGSDKVTGKVVVSSSTLAPENSSVLLLAIGGIPALALRRRRQTT